ncbi:MULTISPECIES: agmatine/peptidylarginine deiminase [Micrococcaceae]|uniref:agmatine deiminase family protein n=1 Tax=Micrococcaceae TaxID=1268 RepID=UPI00160D780D|nr:MULTISPECIES: agmatine deiminase family protein [Micrococcaceae]MBB5749916.1 agmatine deiminase [Micrococcus sp. TA1]HRO31413.1 agmatine deiminase family protein [Citricoccus sp.]HRO93227.1 agmatine deiminase family protein [Citricoccus sp.]
MTTLGPSVMPPEWAPHERTWMSFPTPNDTFGAPGSEGLGRARTAWTSVARTIARYEPVTVVSHPQDEAAARDLLGSDVEILPAVLDDAWMRDSGPTFTLDPFGALSAVNWVFNGWGAQSWARWDQDRHLAATVAHHAQVPARDSRLVNEGGGFHVDGRGTVLLTETVQLDPDRNPGLTRSAVEAEIHHQLGTTHAVWLSRGLTRDYDGFGTRGHVDIVASFTEAGTVLLHRQDDPGHPDHQVTRRLREELGGAVDAQGRPLRVVDVPAPSALRDAEGWVDYSYINHYVANGAVILCAFGEPEADALAAGILGEAYPGRTVELVDARDIFAFGGGIHCITQQQPAAGADRGTLAPRGSVDGDA